MQLNVQGIIAEGNIVAVQEHSMHQPSDKSYKLVAMEWFKIEDTKIKRRWGARDSASQAKPMCIHPST